MMKENKIVKLSDKVYVTSESLMEFGGYDSYVDAYEGSKSRNMSRAGYAFWGKNDSELYKMHELCSKNPTKWRLIQTRRDFVLAKGLKVRIEKFENNKILKLPIIDETSKAINAKLKMLNFKDIIKNAAFSQEFCGRYYVKITLGFDKKIARIDFVDCFHCRPRIMSIDEHKVMAYGLSVDFGTDRIRKNSITWLPAFDAENPTKFMVSILDVKSWQPGQMYNSFAAWWGTEDWTRVANKIPEFHEKGLDNGYNIKYHIAIHGNYFDVSDFSEDEKEQLKRDTCRKIDETLKGKTDSVFFTFPLVDTNGNTIAKVEVTPLPNPMTDTAFTAIFKMAHESQSAAHGVIPVLGGIDTGGKLGGSGKEMEVAANYTQNFLTFDARENLIKLFDIVKEIEGWPEEYVAEFEDVVIYNPDVTPKAASANLNENNEDV